MQVIVRGRGLWKAAADPAERLSHAMAQATAQPVRPVTCSQLPHWKNMQFSKGKGVLGYYEHKSL